MTLRFSILTLVYVVAACISGVAAVFAWNRRRASGGTWLFLMLLSTVTWAITDAFEISSTTLAGHILWSKLSYFGSTTLPVFLLLFAIEYTGGRRFLTPGFIAALFIVPALSILNVLFNESLPLIWTSVEWAPSGGNIVVYHHGPAYWAVTIYLFVATLCATVILVRFALRARSVYRSQSVIIIAALAISWAANIVYDVNPTRFPGISTSVTFAFTGALLTYGMIRHGLLNLVPIARGALVEVMEDGVLVIDELDRIVDANPAATTLLAATRSSLIGKTVDVALTGLPELADAIGRASSDGTQERAAIVAAESHLDVQVTPVCISGREQSGRLVVLRDVSHYKHIEEQLVAVNADLRARVTDVVELQAELQEAAIRDPLTGLYNRRFMSETLDREFRKALRERYPISVVMLDIDYFKQVNDRLGHASGDQLLAKLGDLLASHTRAGDIACRYGGDEFVIVLPHAEPDDAFQRADAWRVEFAQSVPEWFGKHEGATISCGVAFAPDDGSTADELLASADTAMYEAKVAGRNLSRMAMRPQGGQAQPANP